MSDRSKEIAQMISSYASSPVPMKFSDQVKKLGDDYLNGVVKPPALISVGFENASKNPFEKIAEKIEQLKKTEKPAD